MKNLAVSNVQILVVEDNSRYLDILVEELSGYHYKHIDTAQSPEEARKKLDKRPFDVIVADMRLGDDVSGGFAVVDEVNTRNITSVVIILTANDTVTDCRRAYRMGIWDKKKKNIPGKNPIEELHNSIQDAIKYLNRWGNRKDELWIRENMEYLLVSYPGKYIAVINNAVIESADTEEYLRNRIAERKLPLFLPVIRKIQIEFEDISVADLIKKGESGILEFKSTLQWDVRENKKNKELHFSVLKTIAAFLNTKGGMLVIGAEDNGSIFGLDRDFSLLKNKSQDGFEQTLRDLIGDYIGHAFSPLIKVRFESVDNKYVCIIDVNKATQWAFMKDKDNKKKFFIRAGNTSRDLDGEQMITYIEMNRK